MEADEKLYIDGFNNGYLLAKHEPELAAKLTALANENDYFKGLVSGKTEYETEVREWAKSFSKGSPAKGSKGLEKER